MSGKILAISVIILVAGIMGVSAVTPAFAISMDAKACSQINEFIVEYNLVTPNWLVNFYNENCT